MVEGFEYKSYPAEIVAQILNEYLAGATLERLSILVEGVSFAGAQRVVDEAIKIGVLKEADKHRRGGGFARKRAKDVWRRHPEASAEQVAKIAGCGISTVYRARESK